VAKRRSTIQQTSEGKDMSGTHRSNRSNGFAEGAFCAAAEAQSKATAIAKIERIIAARSYHFVIAVWRGNKTESRV
jgi:hypothetical protein